MANYNEGLEGMPLPYMQPQTPKATNTILLAVSPVTYLYA